MKKSKKLFSLFLALVMVLTSFAVVPFTASAKPSEGFGVIRTANAGDRLKDGKVTVCNDNLQDSTTAALWTFNISDVDVTSQYAKDAKLNLSWERLTGADSDSGTLWVYEVASDKIASYVSASGIMTTMTNWSYGGQQKAGFMRELGIKDSDLLGEAPTSAGSASIDVSNAVNTALEAGKDKFSIIIMRSVGQDGSAGGWSDCDFVGTAQTLDYTIESAQFDEADLQKSVEYFEGMINDGNIYHNIAPAYDAYVQANRLIDARDYGGVKLQTADITRVVSAFAKAIEDMTVWTSTANSHGSFSGDKNYVRDEDYAQTYKNVIWASNVTTAQDENKLGNGNDNDGNDVRKYAAAASDSYNICSSSFGRSVWANSNIYHPSAVLLWDGINETVLPVLARPWADANGGIISVDYTVFSYYLENSSNLELRENWRGAGDASDSNWIWLHDGATKVVNFTDEKDSSDHFSGANSEEKRFFYTNLMYFTNTNNFFGDNEYQKKIPNDFSWSHRGKQGNSGGGTGKSLDISMQENDYFPIYVVDYSKVKPVVENAYNTFKTAVTTGKEGEVAALAEALDKATFSHQDAKYDYAGNTQAAVEQLGNDLSAAVTTLNAASASADVEYAALRTAIKDSWEAYSKCDEMYNTTHTWLSVKAFKTAYESAVAHMAALQKDNYSTDVSAVKAFADNLNNARNGLELRADLTEIKAVWHQGLELLEKLSKNTQPRYLSSDVQELIDNMNTYAVYGSPDKSDPDPDSPNNEFNIGVHLKNQIDTACDILKQDIANLESGQVDMSAFAAAVEVAENIDLDIFNGNASAEALKELNDVKGTPVEFSFTDNDHGAEEIKGSIQVIKDDAMSQDAIDKIINDMITVLNSNINSYKVTVPENVSVTYASGAPVADLNAVPYGTQLKFTVKDSDVKDAAWFMEFNSNQASRGKQFISNGTEISQNVIGNINVTVETRSEATPNLVKIIRDYGDIGVACHSVNYVADNDTFTLPEPALTNNYAFEGYLVNGETKKAGDVLTITKDTYIYAKYVYAADNFNVEIEDSTLGASVTKQYQFNQKVTLTAADGKDCWVEYYIGVDAQPHTRAFSPNKTVTFFVSESTKLIAVTKDVYNEVLGKGAVNLRRDGVMITENNGITYTNFNAQVVLPEGAELLEKGILVAKPDAPTTDIDDDKVTLDNISKYAGVTIIRGKSTKHTVAMQYALKAKGDLRRQGVHYKGYLIYKDADGKTVTIYSEPMTIGVDK